MGHALGSSEDFPLAALEPMPDVEPAMTAAFQNALLILRRSGVVVRHLDIVEMLAKLVDASDTVLFYEAARIHLDRFNQYGYRLGELADLVLKGLQIPVKSYNEARRYIVESKDRMSEIYKATPVILVPAATGPAPLGMAWTGDPRMNAPWTALGTPAISIPMPVSDGMPLGMQLTADHGQDARLLRTAVRLQIMLGS